MIAFIIRMHATYEMGSELEVRAFRFFISFYLLFVLTNGVCLWVNYYRHIPLGYVFSTLSLLSLFLCAFFWFLYVERKLSTKLSDNKGELIIFCVPAMACAGLIVTTPFTHLIFSYSAEGVYTRGDLYFFLLATAFFYLLLASGRARQGMINAKTAAQKTEYRYLMFFLVFPIGAGVIDLFIPHLPVMELVVLLAIILVYLTLQQSQIYTDALTGLNNRRVTEDYFKTQLESISEEQPMYVLLGDINKFKNVNDTFGHVEGDRALKAVSRELKAYADKKHYHLARWGGDEFIFIGKKPEMDEPEVVIAELHDRMEELNQKEEFPFKLSMTVGYTAHTKPDVGLDVVIREADHDMYTKKPTV